MRREPTAKEVRKAARAAVQALADNNIDCCVFGSAACHFYGMENRDPADVDIVLLTNDGRDIEYIKYLITLSNAKLYPVDSIDPNATYKKLFYDLGRGRSCKVDVLHPGQATNLRVPVIPKDRINYYYDIPVMPILPLLLMKLQGWVDHRHSKKRWEQAKVQRDAADVREMLELAVDEHGVQLESSDGDWLPTGFIYKMEGRVEEYVKKFPDSREYWEYIGFDV
ncbi:hypothetical protein Moror_5251 [Moniliophthora roreri MCA 2997]|uniref:Uncharacterized protein n=2 Tax=Moniliophthora roreri TaxID=221103 RepID=V2X8R0_MONRO|nr:hypothetical protein Moror_5251 [Moniliophthora roreri MCA 2997]KAI3609993.1 hypothetical protein WG66_007276 [Moniliophthora roreri]